MQKSGRERLREYCTRYRYKQYELAELLGLADAHLSQILSGKRTPSLLTAVRIQDTTGVPVESWAPREVGGTVKRKRQTTKTDEIPNVESGHVRS